jgi:hypothetical protein
MARREPKEPTRQVHILISDYEKVRAEAVRLGITMKEVIRQAVAQAIAPGPKTKKEKV